jgi:RHS repeat-associated protein
VLALKHFDPIIGVDLHIIQPPGPVPPVPIPHPHVAMIFDAVDYVPIIGATVKVNGLIAARAGTAGQAAPPHIPMGGMFVKPPTNESQVFMGSATVLADGAPMAFMGVPVLTCQDIGIPAPFRKGKSPAKTLMLPVGVALSIPSGPPVMVGGPPTIDMMAVGFSAGRLAAGPALGVLKKAASKSKRLGRVMKAASQRAHKAADKAMDKLGVGDKARNAVHRKICSLTGHPVDVATGKVLTEAVDFEIPGPIPFRWERVWYSTSTLQGPLGHGWHHPLDLRLIETQNAVAVRMPDGRAVAFPPVAEGGDYRDRKERATLSRDGRGYALRDSEGLIYRFAPGCLEQGCLLQSIEDTGGNRIALSHDDKGRLERVVDSGGRSFDFAFDGFDRITAIEGPDPSTPAAQMTLVRYFYDSSGNLVAVQDALGQQTRFEYEGHLLTREMNRNGLSFYFKYDGADEKARCIRTWGDGGIYDHKLSYNLEAYITTVEDSLGHKTTHHHQDGMVFKTVDALGNTTITERTSYAEVAVETNAIGLKATREYDDRGNETARTYYDGAVTRSAYEGDRLVEVTDAVGGKWSIEYDAKGRVTRRTNPLGQSMRYFYNERFLLGTADAANHGTTLKYDAAGNLIEAIAADLRSTRFRYDGLGRLIGEIDVNGNHRERKLDALGRVVRINEPDGNVRELEYDREGNVVRAKDQHRDVRFHYQGMNKLAAREEAGTTVRFQYDTEERLVGIQNEHGFVYRFELGPTGEVNVETGFDGIRREFKRDPLGQVIEMRRPDGRLTKYVYDAAGRVMVAAQPDASSQYFKYRADGELIEAMNGIVTVKLERDALGRVVKEQQGEHWVETEYGPTGPRVRMNSSLGAKQEIERNEMDDVVGIRAGPFTAGFQRDGLGLEVNREICLWASEEAASPREIWSSWKRDHVGRPILQRRNTRASVEARRSYRWDVDDRLTNMAQSGVDSETASWEAQYFHDEVGNLEAAEYSHNGSRELELRVPDAVGNLFRTEAQTDREYGPAGQLLASEGPNGVTSYKYDAEGNLARKLEPNGDEWSYAWDAAGMLVKVVRPDGCVVEFEYDALGRRVTKKLTTRQFKSRVTRWVWDGNNPLHEWVEERERPGAKMRAPDGELKVRFHERRGRWPITAFGRVRPKAEPGTRDAPITWLFEPESFAPIGKMVGDSIYGIITDHLGAPVAMYDKEGNDVWAADLGTYGQIWNLKGLEEACPFRWPGQYEDGETGLYYNRFRYYDPGMGVYISQDPIGLVGSARLHAYPGDPLQLIDPNGLAKSKSGCDTRGNPRLSVDFASKSTVNYSAAFASERDARAFARTKLGKSPLEVEPGKLRSRNGRWQYRAKSADLAGHGIRGGAHIHLERLNPTTGEVLENWHLRW